jgi:hypothetical protein
MAYTELCLSLSRFLLFLRERHIDDIMGTIAFCFFAINQLPVLLLSSHMSEWVTIRKPGNSPLSSGSFSGERQYQLFLARFHPYHS